MQNAPINVMQDDKQDKKIDLGFIILPIAPIFFASVTHPLDPPPLGGGYVASLLSLLGKVPEQRKGGSLKPLSLASLYSSPTGVPRSPPP